MITTTASKRLRIEATKTPAQYIGLSRGQKHEYWDIIEVIMAFNAVVLQVMIASPSDVPQERSIIRVVLEEWNTLHAESLKTVLLPLSWESHASPELGNRPQEVINKQVLHDADILIAVFWTRIGSPTGVAPSGTVEEIREHVAAGKPAMVYFSSKPVQPENLDQDQWNALSEFRRECEERGLIETYQTEIEFKDKVSRQLHRKIIEYGKSPHIDELSLAVDGRDKKTESSPLNIHLQLLNELSAEAQTLLKEASIDSHGAIFYISVLMGDTIQTNDKAFPDTFDARQVAIWKSALSELLRNGLVDHGNVDGTMYSVTALGYKVADLIN